MLKEIKMYTVVCDNCGKDSNEDADYGCYSEADFAEESAMESDWIKVGDKKHYCTNCFSYDDNDNLILREIKK